MLKYVGNYHYGTLSYGVITLDPLLWPMLRILWIISGMRLVMVDNIRSTARGQC